MKKIYKISLFIVCFLLLVLFVLFALDKNQERIDKKKDQESFEKCMQEYQRYKQGDPNASDWFAGVTNPEIVCMPQAVSL